MENTTAAQTTNVPRYSYYALAVLTLINFLNYIDRQVLPSVASFMADDPQLRLTDSELGLIEGVLLFSYTILAPVFGRLGDRKSRTRLMASAAIIWSIATGCVGFVDRLPFLPASVSFHIFSFVSHIPFLPQSLSMRLASIAITLSGGALAICLMRAVVGVGESSYSTITPTLIADYFPPAKRATALGIFQAAIPLGFALGFVIGGVLAGYFGWRFAFLIVGLPGLLASLLVWKLKEPVRGGTDLDAHGHEIPPPDPNAPQESWWKTTRRILFTSDWLLATAGYTALTFVLGAFATWGTLMLARDKGMSKTQAAIALGLVTLFGGAVGTFGGGWLADRLIKRRKDAYWLVCASSALLGFIPALLAIITGQTYFYLPAIFFAVLCVFLNNAPFHAILLNSVPATIRASAVALNIVVIHACGDLLSRPGVGFLSDALKAGGVGPLAKLAQLLGLNPVEQHLSAAMLVAPLALLLSAGFYLWGAKKSATRQKSMTVDAV